MCAFVNHTLHLEQSCQPICGTHQPTEMRTDFHQCTLSPMVQALPQEDALSPFSNMIENNKIANGNENETNNSNIINDLGLYY